MERVSHKRGRKHIDFVVSTRFAGMKRESTIYATESSRVHLIHHTISHLVRYLRFRFFTCLWPGVFLLNWHGFAKIQYMIRFVCWRFSGKDANTFHVYSKSNPAKSRTSIWVLGGCNPRYALPSGPRWLKHNFPIAPSIFNHTMRLESHAKYIFSTCEEGYDDTIHTMYVSVVPFNIVSHSHVLSYCYNECHR